MVALPEAFDPATVSDDLDTSAPASVPADIISLSNTRVYKPATPQRLALQDARYWDFYNLQLERGATPAEAHRRATNRAKQEAEMIARGYVFQASNRPAPAAPVARRPVNDNKQSRQKFVVERHGEPSPYPAPSWLIKNYLPAEGLCLLAGASEAGKTFLAIHLAVALATQTPFLDKPLRKRAGTVMLLGEGRGTIRKRIDAAVKALDDDVVAEAMSSVEDADLGRLAINYVVCKLSTVEERQAALLMIRQEATRMRDRHGLDLGLVIVDTLAACCLFEDENSSGETTKAMTALAEMATDLGCLMLPLAHYGKSLETGVRGSSALTASADVILAATATKDSNHVVTHRQLVLAKTRDGETGETIPYKIESITLGLDEDGDPITTGAVKLTDGTVIVRQPRADRLSQAAQAYLRAYDAVGQEAIEIRPFGEEGLRVRAVLQTTIKTEFFASYSPAAASDALQQDAKRKSFTNGQRTLIEKRKLMTRELAGIAYVWKL